MPYGANTGIEIEELAQADIQAAKTATDRGREWALNGQLEFTDSLQGLLRQIGSRQLIGFLARIDFHPGDLAFAAITMLHRFIKEKLGGFPYVRPDSVPFDKTDDGVVRGLEFAVFNDDLVAFRDYDVLIGCHDFS